MRTYRIVITLAAIIALGMIAGCASTPAPTAPPTAISQPPAQETAAATPPLPTTETATPEPPAETPTEVAPETPVETPAGPVWIADGIIGDDEYTDTADFGRIRLWWRHDGEYLYLAMEGETSGWVSIGIEPSRGMKDADYLLGFVINGEAKLWDAFGMGVTGATHPPDEEIGGTNDILEFAGIEDDNITRFELKRLLDTGDIYDKALAPGNTYNIIVAIGNADDFNGYHSAVRSGQMTLRP